MAFALILIPSSECWISACDTHELLAAVNRDFLVVEARFHDRSQAEVVQTMCRTCTLQHGQVITKLQWIGHGYDIPRNDTIALPLE